MSTENTNTDAAFALPAVLNLGTAEQLREKFMEAIIVDSDIALEASEVSTLTTPCLQVLISAGQTVEANGRVFSVTNPSSAFKEAFDDLGLTEIFNKWSIQ
ncbi:MAG: STAS domain-containing protein [Sneathiella sp.]